MKQVTLQSGRELKLAPASFTESKALYQAVLREIKTLDIAKDFTQEVNMFKEIFCAVLASKEIESCVMECMKKCTYQGHKLTIETFESEEAREDYTEICVEVAMLNIRPFTKSLFALFAKGAQLVASMKESAPATT